MGQSLIEIAEVLKNSPKKVQLIYAFNGTGKTRLSREFKELVAPKNEVQDNDTELSRNKIIYYNAFTEDLFYWDNDLDTDAEPKLKIQPNSFTDWILQDQGQDQNIISYFQRFSNGKLTPKFNPEYTTLDENQQRKTVKAFSEVTFSLQRGDDDNLAFLKISKGEESNFVWSVFYTLLEQVIDILSEAEPDARETDQFNNLEYIYIDDPVSSLDENHLIELAVGLAKLINSSYFSKDGREGLKFIISTHNTVFYNVLYNELKLKNGYILSKYEDGSFNVEEKKGDSNKSFSYHLYIKALIEKAVSEKKVERYHFTLLRNLYEKTAAFLGYQYWSDLLPGDQKVYATRVMNFYSHNTLSNQEISEPTPPEAETVKLLLENLDQYGLWKK
ncbi:AAA family ATPase [Vibrio alginolyticus]|uniref:AAA family ATPase n=1 Tax=Vibrio alginolyticus TaxID=663 RepID=UPI003F67B956